MDPAARDVSSEGGPTTTMTVGPVRTGATASLILGWVTVGDTVTSLVLVLVGVLTRPLVGLALTLVVYLTVELASCTWLNGHWDDWRARAGDKMRARAERMRSSRLLQPMVRWITGSSDVGFAVAAALTSPAVAVTVSRLVVGERVARTRVVWSCVAYALVMGGVVTLLAWVIGG